MLITVLMLASVALLQGCTQFDKSDRKQKEWQLWMEAPNEGGCFISVEVRADDEISDDTLKIEHLRGIEHIKGN